MRNQFVKALVATSLTVTLAACGGGGGSSGGSAGSATSTLSFPFKSAFVTSTAAGFTKSGTVSGSCSGTVNLTMAPASTSATFEGTAGLSAAVTITGTYTNCTPASFAVSATNYYDTNYIPLGNSGGQYAVYTTAITIPTSLKVGDTGIIGTENLYTSNTKLTLAGRNDLSYVVEADTASTAIVNLIINTYNPGGSLTQTEQNRYRIGATGPWVLVSIDYQSGTTAHHEVWTMN